MKPRKQIMRMGYNDALTACNESGSGEAPDGGWDSWLINGVGVTATCELFGVRKPEGPSWDKACRWYSQGARTAAAKWDY